MANSKIPKGVNIGAWESVSVPYTAPCDGFFKAYLNPSNANSAVAIYSVAGSWIMPNFIRINAHNGYAEMGVFPVKRAMKLH